MPFSAEQCRFRWFLGQEQGSIEQCNGLGSRLTSHHVNISFWFPRTWLNVWAPAPMHSSSSSSNRRSAFKRCSHSGSDKSSEMFCLDKRRENTGKKFLHLNWNTFTFLEAIPKSPWSFAFANQEKKKGHVWIEDVKYGEVLNKDLRPFECYLLLHVDCITLYLFLVIL